MKSPQRIKRKARRFVTWYRYWRTGKIMIASEYGYKAWPFG